MRRKTPGTRHGEHQNAVKCRFGLNVYFPEKKYDDPIVDCQSQTDPQFRTNRLYTRLDAAEVRRQLIAQKGYGDAQLPTERTIATKLTALGYYPTKVAKTQPQKRSQRPTPSSTS